MKKVKSIATCRECSHCIPITDRNLSTDKKPILLRCRFNKYDRLLSEDNCEHFNQNNKQRNEC